MNYMRIIFCLLMVVGSMAIDIVATKCLGDGRCFSRRDCSRLRVTHGGACDKPCSARECRRKSCNSCHGECSEGQCEVEVEEEEEQA